MRLQRLLIFAALLATSCTGLTPEYAQISVGILSSGGSAAPVANVVTPTTNGCVDTTSAGVCTTPGNIGPLQTVDVAYGACFESGAPSISVSSGTATLTAGTLAVWFTGICSDYHWLVNGMTVGSPLTVTITLGTGGSSPILGELPLQGSISAPIHDGSVPLPATGNGVLLTSGNVTTSAANRFILGTCQAQQVPGIPFIAGTTPQTMTLTGQTSTSTFNALEFEYGTAVSSGSNYAECGLTGGGYWVMDIEAFK